MTTQMPEGGNVVKLVRSAPRDAQAEKCLIKLIDDIFHSRSLQELQLGKISGVDSAGDEHWHAAAEAMTSVAQSVDRLRAIELAEDALTDLTAPEHHRSAWVALLVLVMADELVAADYYCENLLSRAEWHADAPALRVLRLIRARVNALVGEPDLAIRILIDQMRADEIFLRPIAASWLADAHLRTDDTKAASNVLNLLLGRRASTAMPRYGCPGGVFARLTIADTQMAAGRHLAALASYLYCGVELRDAHFVNGAVIPWGERAARAAAEVGLSELSAALATHTLDASMKWRSPRTVVSSLHLHAQLADSGVGVTTPAISRSLLTMANMAEIGVWSALTGTTSPTERRVRDEDLAPSVTSRRTITLTGSEMTVARLARAGCTNTEIARRLSLAVRTVEFHLSSVYRKLGIANRRELRSSTFLVTEDPQSARAYRVEVELSR